MMVLVVFQIVLTHKAYANKDQLESDLDNRLNYTLHQADKDPALYASWDLLQNNVSIRNGSGATFFTHWVNFSFS